MKNCRLKKGTCSCGSEMFEGIKWEYISNQITEQCTHCKCINRYKGSE